MMKELFPKHPGIKIYPKIQCWFYVPYLVCSLSFSSEVFDDGLSSESLWVHIPQGVVHGVYPTVLIMDTQAQTEHIQHRENLSVRVSINI